jgi:hypothetical protein
MTHLAEERLGETSEPSGVYLGRLYGPAHQTEAHLGETTERSGVLLGRLSVPAHQMYQALARGGGVPAHPRACGRAAAQEAGRAVACIAPDPLLLLILIILLQILLLLLHLLLLLPRLRVPFN